MMTTKKRSINIAVIFVTIFYLAISDFFGLLDASLFIPGELYEYIFVLLIIYAVASRRTRFRIPKKKIVILPYLLLIVLAIIHATLLEKAGSQGLLESFSVMIELMFIITFLAFYNLRLNVRKIIKCLVRLDSISVFIYALEMFHGGPIISSSIHSSGLYEPLGGIVVWRCWVDLPTFEFFTLPFLLLSIVKKQGLFSTIQKDKACFFIIFIGVVLKLGRTELFAVLLCLILAYFYADRITAARILKKTVKIFLCSIPLVTILFFAANGMFMRIINGLIDIFTSSSLTDGSVSTFATRTSTLYVRWNYLIEHGRLLSGIGPYSYKATLVIDPYDLYATNRGVLAPDSAYGTFLIRYGIVGTGLFVFGNIRNFNVLKKEKSIVCIATGIFLIGMLIGGFSGYDAMGKQSLIKMGILFALCACEMKRGKRSVLGRMANHL